MFGLVFVILGMLATKEKLLKHAMHAAAALALLGFLATAALSFPKLPALLSGGEVERPNAVIAQAIMAALCAVFVGLCIKSFLDARRRRADRASSEQIQHLR